MSTNNPVNLTPVLNAQSAALIGEIDQNQTALASALTDILAKIALESDQNAALINALSTVNGEIDSSVDAIDGLITAAKDEVLAGGAKQYQIASYVRGIVPQGSSGVVLSVVAPVGGLIKITGLIGASNYLKDMRLTINNNVIFEGVRISNSGQVGAYFSDSSEFCILPAMGDGGSNGNLYLGGALEPQYCTSFEVTEISGVTRIGMAYSYEILEAV
jgi:hypothetical protein